MYQSAFLEHRLDKAAFRAEEPKLRAELLEAQLELVEKRAFAVLVLVTGMDGAGKGAVIQRLYAWLDPRHLRTNGYGEPDEARELEGRGPAGGPQAGRANRRAGSRKPAPACGRAANARTRRTGLADRAMATSRRV